MTRRSSCRARPPDPRLARQPDRRGRRRARVGRVRARRRSLRRLDGRARGGRAARRRRGVGRQGRVAGGRERARRDRRGGARPRRRGPARRSTRALIDARRHAEQGPARRERDPRRLARRPRRPRRRTRGSRSSATSAASDARDAAGADDERDQRRRARHELDRPPGVHGRPGRRGDRSPRGCGSAPRSSTRSKKVLHERGLSTGVGDEGGFAPDLDSSEAAIEAILEAAEHAGHRERVAIALDPAASEVYRTARYRFEGARPRLATRCPASTRARSTRYPIVSIEDGARRGRLGRVGGADARARRPVQLVGDDLFVTNVERLQEGIDRGVANAILVKVNQIGTLTETIEAIRLAQDERLHGGDVPPLRRDRGHDDRRPRRRDRRGPDQDGRARPAPTAWRSTTSCSGSRRSWAPRPAIRGGTRFRALRPRRAVVASRYPKARRERAFACTGRRAELSLERTVGQLLSYAKARLEAGLRCPGPRRPDSNRHLSNGRLVALPVELLRDLGPHLRRSTRPRKMAGDDWSGSAQNAPA